MYHFYLILTIHLILQLNYQMNCNLSIIGLILNDIRAINRCNRCIIDTNTMTSDNRSIKTKNDK